MLKAKFVNESLFQPKDEISIRKSIEEMWPIRNIEEATDILAMGINRQILPIVKYALENGALGIDNEYSGKLWLAFNSIDSKNKQNSENIIIEIIKYLNTNNTNLWRGILDRMLYMGCVNVAKYCVDNNLISRDDALYVLYNYDYNAEHPGHYETELIFKNLVK